MTCFVLWKLRHGCVISKALRTLVLPSFPSVLLTASSYHPGSQRGHAKKCRWPLRPKSTSKKYTSVFASHWDLGVICYLHTPQTKLTNELHTSGKKFTHSHVDKGDWHPSICINCKSGIYLWYLFPFPSFLKKNFKFCQPAPWISWEWNVFISPFICNTTISGQATIILSPCSLSRPLKRCIWTLHPHTVPTYSSLHATVHRCSPERTVSITTPWGLETSSASPGSRERSDILNLESSPSPPGSPVSAYPSFPLNLNGPATPPFFLLLDKHAVFNLQALHVLFPYLEFSISAIIFHLQISLPWGRRPGPP